MIMNYTENYWDDTANAAKQIPNLERLFGCSLLITCATGMIGSAVADLIFYLNQQKQANIHLLLAGRSREKMQRRFSHFQMDRDYEFIFFEATDPAIMDLNADYIIHTASNASPAAYTKQPAETMLANLVGLNALLDLMCRSYTRRLLYVSSSEVYGTRMSQKVAGENPGNNRALEEKKTHGTEPGTSSMSASLSSVPYREDEYGYVDLLNPRACYPCAKRAAETLCISYDAEYKTDTVIVRPGHIYGPSITASDTRASAQFTRNAVLGQDIVMKSAGAQLRSYCYTLDCASAILTVLLNGQRSTAYNISNPNSIVTIRELAEALAKAAGTKVICQEATASEKKGYNLMDNSSLDSSLLESLGWRPCFSLEEGAAKTIEYLREA